LALAKAKPKSAIKHTKPIRKKLVFAEKLHYEAHKGYARVEQKSLNDHLHWQWTKTQPSIKIGTAIPLANVGALANSSKSSVAVQPSPDAEHEAAEPQLIADEEIVNQEPTGLEEVVEDIAFCFWKCSKCLSMGHNVSDCTNQIRCKNCYFYGHIAKNCIKRFSKSRQQWVPKRVALDSLAQKSRDSPLLLTTAISVPRVLPIATPTQQRDSHTSMFQSPISTVTERSMANFEVDHLPWLPWGHHIIDSGPTRLPRSFYYPIEDPLLQHQAYCYAVVHPAPPPRQEGFWHDQVRDLLIGPLHRDLVEVQPSLFGVGLYQFSGPNAVNALVQHGPYPLPPLHHNRSVRFVHVNDAINHRATQGFRTDWLMILGIPPDYHNDVHIANAISSFGKFYFWNRIDPIKCRALVYASFPSPTHVSRDVVFGKFANVGGVRESWTTPVYILTAEFADALPADEDQMPLNGNPHPLPGNLQINQNMFVVPPFPKIGWDAAPEENI
jgi:hypothetical protein